jgi:hypothetical protein
MASERRRYLEVLEEQGVDEAGVHRLREVSRRVDAVRIADLQPRQADGA